MAPLTQAPAAGAERAADADYLRGVLLVALAGVFWSIGGVLIRWIEAANPWQVIFYRSLALALTLLLIVALRHRGRLATAFAGIGGAGLLASVCLSGGFIGYVLALDHISVANAVFMLGTAPFFAAILGRWFLREDVRRATWLTMALALCGVAVMVGGSLVIGTITGNLLALGSSLSFAGFNILLRKGRANDMMPCVVIAGLVAALISAPVVVATAADAGAPAAFVLGARDFGLCLAMGSIQVGFGLTAFTLGARHVPAVELALLSMSELVLAPFWVWLAISEVPSVSTLVGGAIVLTAVAVQALSGARRRRAPPMV
jgi:drug/metabolite transporter (DMT)-like permease